MVYQDSFTLNSISGGNGSLPTPLKLNRSKKLVIAWLPCYHAHVIQSFKDAGTEHVFNGVDSKQARRACPASLWRIAARKLDQLDSVVSLRELDVPPGNQLKALSGGRKGQHSIRINDQYRICFVWTDAGPEQVEITDYH
jgi:proteic killer suppression protein